MGKLEGKGMVPESEVLADCENKPLIEDIITKLKESVGKGLVYNVATTSTSKAEAKNDVNKLRHDIKKLGKASEFANVMFTVSDCGDNKFRILAKFSDKKKKPGKVNKKASNKHQPGANEGLGQDMSVEKMKNQMLENINNMPPQAMAMFLPQVQASLEQKQKQLSAPDVNETHAARLKEEIQMMQEIIEAIKKKQQ